MSVSLTKTTKPVRTTVRDCESLVTSRTPFVAGTMRGAFLTAGTATPGEMPDEWRPVWSDAVHKYGRDLFVVWSFETPIAWRGPDGQTVIPDVTYGSRTARHQTIVRVAWDAHMTRLPGEVQVRVMHVTRPDGGRRTVVHGPAGQRTFGYDYSAGGWHDGALESAVRTYAADVLGLSDFRVNERHTRSRGRHFVILPD